MNNQELRSITFGQLHMGTIFKIGFFSNLFFWGGFAALFGVLALFGVDIVKWNGAYVYGPGALLAALLIGGVFTLIGSVILMLGGMMAAWASRRFGFGELTFFVTVDTPKADGTGTE
jgi:hypothetical protein